MIADSLRVFSDLILAGENGFEKEISWTELHSCTTRLTESKERDFLWAGESAAFYSGNEIFHQTKNVSQHLSTQSEVLSNVWQRGLESVYDSELNCWHLGHNMKIFWV